MSRAQLSSLEAAPPEADEFLALVRDQDRRLRALAYRILQDRERMDDALQISYLKAFRAYPAFRHESRPSTWLYRIVYNTCLDMLRRPVREAALRTIDYADQQPGPDRVATDRIDVERALGALPPEQRAALWLVDGEGRSYDDAATVLGIPVGTLGWHLHEGRSNFRRALGWNEEVEDA